MKLELEELELLVLLLRDEVVSSPSCREPGGRVVVVIGSGLAALELLLE